MISKSDHFLMSLTNITRITSLGGCDEVPYRRRVDAFAIGDTNNEGSRRGSKRTNFQAWAGQAIETLLNESHPAARFDGRHETGRTVMLFSDFRMAFQRREEVREPGVVFGIVGERIGHQPFIGDLLQSDLVRLPQWMRRTNSYADSITANLIEHESAQELLRDLNQQRDMQRAVAQSAQHLLGGHVVKPNGYAGIRSLKKS